MRTLVLAFTTSLLLTAAASAQVVVTGAWDLTVSFLLPEQEVPTSCEYEGTAEVTLEDGIISGPVTLSLVAGGDECPATMSGNLDATWSSEGTDVFVNGTLDGGQLGTADVSGVLSSGALGLPEVAGSFGPSKTPTARSLESSHDPTSSGSGSSVVDTGPFAGVTGVWTASLSVSALAIPALGVVGLGLLVVLIAGMGAVAVRNLSA